MTDEMKSAATPEPVLSPLGTRDETLKLYEQLYGAFDFENDRNAAMYEALRLGFEAGLKRGQVLSGEPKNEVGQLLGKYLNTMVADLGIDGKGQYLRDLFSKYERELAGQVLSDPAPQKELMQIAKELHINYCEDLADEGTPWEVPAEPEPEYFESLAEAVAFYVELMEREEKPVLSDSAVDQPAKQENLRDIEHDWPYGNLLVFRECLQRAYEIGIRAGSVLGTQREK